VTTERCTVQDDILREIPVYSDDSDEFDASSLPCLTAESVVGRNEQIPMTLAPTILIGDIGERNTANRPEPAYKVADQQQGLGMHAGRKAQSGLRFFLELQAERCRCRTEALTRRFALLQNFGAQAVIAIENARLLTETRQSRWGLVCHLARRVATQELRKGGWHPLEHDVSSGPRCAA